MIGKENIEEKMFEYFEGELTASEAQEVERFIQENPSFQADFDAWKLSSVEVVNYEYKHVDDLLVAEKSSPRGWFKWSAGGALFFLLAITSFGIVHKYKNEDAQISDVQNSDKRSLNLAAADHQDANTVLTTAARVGREADVVQESVAVTKTNQVSQEVAANATRESKKTNRAQNTTGNSSNGDNIKRARNTFAATNEQSNNTVPRVLGNDESLDVIGLASLVRLGYSFSLNRYIKDARFSYENLNKPNFVLANFRDPYLNYNLAHSIEENGAFVGNGGEGIRIETLYRTEWPSATKQNFTSQIISLDTRIDALRGGVGVMINADRIGHGKLNANAISLIYSPKFIVGKLSIEPAFKYTYNTRDIAWGQVDKNDVKDPRNGVLYASVPFTPDDVAHSTMVYHDFGLGLLVNADKFYIGGQIDHINAPSYDNDLFDQQITIPYKMSFMTGTDILKKKDGVWLLSPSLNFVSFGNYNALWGNVQTTFKNFFFSGAFATNEEVMASFGYKNDKVRLVYGLGLSKPSEFSGLEVTGKYYESHQLSLRVNLKPKAN